MYLFYVQGAREYRQRYSVAPCCGKSMPDGIDVDGEPFHLYT